MKKILSLVLGIMLIITGNLFILSSCTSDDWDDNTVIDTAEDISEYFDPTLPSGVIEFTHSIMNSEDFDRIIPLGQINPPGHTFPTDHIYFVLSGYGKTIYAPTRGKILHIDEPGAYGDSAVRVGVTSSMAYYLGHIFVSTGLQVGDTIEAGSQIAISGNTSCVDFGIVNQNINNGFISEKHPRTTLYGDKPLSYYNEPLRTQLYSLVKPPQPSDDPEYVYNEGVTDGEFAYDELGTLSGNWFEEGCFIATGWYEWDNTLAFGYDNFYPEQIRIATGKISNSFAIKNEDNPIMPKDVNITSGAVAYYLYNANNTSKGIPTSSRVGLMMVQMLSDTRIKLEIFEDITSETRQFTSAALYYVR